MRFCAEKHADPMSSSINLILDFLATLFNSGIGYSGINTARSALSSFLMLNGQVSVGNNTLVKRFMRGIFLLKPSLPRYNFTWDVSIFLHYLQTLSNDSLTLKQMTLKLCALLSLLTAQRLQSIHLIDKRNILFSKSVVKIRIGDLVKQSKPGKHLSEIVLNSYVNKDLCIVTCLKMYLQMTEHLRGQESRLFISFVAPYKGVSKDTISRWMRTIMTASGIDTSFFKPHSVRSASVSAVSDKGLPLATILRTAGWSNQCTFRKLYNRPITVDTGFCTAILDCVNKDK